MHRQCWCGEPGPSQAAMDMVAAMPFEDFITKPWMVGSGSGACTCMCAQTERKYLRQAGKGWEGNGRSCTEHRHGHVHVLCHGWQGL
eukprot:366317-Chlamydomonas_euryale.AAC.3